MEFVKMVRGKLFILDSLEKKFIPRILVSLGLVFERDRQTSPPVCLSVSVCLYVCLLKDAQLG